MVALKRLKRDLAGDAEFEERFRRESSLAARLSSPHVVPIHDFGEIDGQLYIDMRLVAGSDLGAMISSGGGLSASEAVQITGHVADALDCAHADGLIHRDVKPSNVLVTANRGRHFAYLSDFGIVRAEAGGGSSLTRTGTTIGTFAYMAPELFTGAAMDKRVDVYALGCLLFEAVTGQPPFSGDDAVLMYKHLNQPPPVPSEIRPELGTGLDAVIRKAMAKDPAQRYSSAGELADEAHQGLSASSEAASKAGPPAETQVNRSDVETAIHGGSTSMPSTRAEQPRPSMPAEPPSDNLIPLATPRRHLLILTAVGIVAALVVIAAAVSSHAGDGRASEAGPAASSTASSGSGLSTETSDTGDASSPRPFTIREQAWSVSSSSGATNYVHWAAVVDNPNKSFFGSFPTLRITARDANGGVVGADEQVLESLPPAGTIAFAGQVSASAKPSTVTVEYAKVEWSADKLGPDRYPKFSTAGISVGADTIGSQTVSGEVRNPYSLDVSQLAITSLYRDVNGKLVGGATSFVDGIPAGKDTPFTVKDLGGSAPKSFKTAEVIAIPWGSDDWGKLAAGSN
jgi:serine/threonine protein kinase